MLVLEIEYLTGVVFAARGPESSVPDWPPQPDRIFSALVATWGAHGERSDEAEALKWLEKQSTPVIAASETEARSSALRFVPPNDPKTGKSGNKEILPVFRRRQPRMFPAARPHDPVIHLCWKDSVPDEQTLASLRQLAANTAYVGHSSSLTRWRFLQSGEPLPAEAQQPRRTIYKGRFQELCEYYERNQRPRPGDYVTSTVAHRGKSAQSCFSSDWLILEHTGGEMPDIRAAALVAKEIRNTLLSGYQQNSMADRIPTIVSGHTSDGRPTSEPHLAIVPLAFAGFPYADGHLLGFALVPPRDSHLFDGESFDGANFLQAMRKVAPFTEERRSLQLETMRLRSFDLRLSPTFEPSKISLKRGLYTKEARVFATVTPIVLDRHLKEKGAEREEEITAQIKAACRNIGLPEPEKVVPDKHSAIEGTPSAYPSGNSPEWMRWQAPASLTSRALTHAVISFSEPVAGPVILGAGRFVGLGLCRPLDDAEADA